MTERGQHPGGFPAGAAIAFGVIILGFVAIASLAIEDWTAPTRRGFPGWVPFAVLAAFGVVLVVRGVSKIRRARRSTATDDA